MISNYCKLIKIKPLLGNALSLACLLPMLCQASGGDELNLRTGKTLSGVSVVSVNEDGIVLEGGDSITLDKIFSATLRDQTEFDRLHATISEDLFRLRLRIQRKDYENLNPPLQRLWPIFAKRNSESSAVVHLASLHDSVLNGKWELAIRAHFNLFRFGSENPDHRKFLRSLGYLTDFQSGLSGQICPFGLDKIRIVEHWESIHTAYRSLPKQHPTGLDFYFFQLAEVGKTEVAPELLANRLKLTSMEKSLIEVLETAVSSQDLAEIEQARVKFMERKFSSEDTSIHQALYFFVNGLLEAKSQTGELNSGLLDLLRIHADFGIQTQSLSAASLFQVSQILLSKESQRESKKVAAELKSRYPSSYFAKQLKIKTTN